MEIFVELLKKVGIDDITSTSHDMAWIARRKEADSYLGGPALEWICEKQHEDGPWGAALPFYFHDRIIGILSAMIALTYKGWPQQDKVRI